MRHTLGAVFAITLASVAAIAATTAYLNSPLHIGPPAGDKPTAPATTPPDDTGKPTEGTGERPAKPADIPDAPSRRGAGAPSAPAPEATKPDASTPDAGKPVVAGQAPDDDKDRRRSLRGHRRPRICRRICSTAPIPASASRRIPEPRALTTCTASTSIITTLSVARDGELVASEPLAVETTTRDARFGRAALAAARGRPDEVSLGHWRELGRHEGAARNVALEMHAHLARAGRGRPHRRAVIAVPADLDAAALAALRGALAAAGVDARDFRRFGNAHRRRSRGSQPLRGARYRVALGDGNARRGRRRVQLRGSVHERARQPARCL
jgi:hypothetical protein